MKKVYLVILIIAGLAGGGTWFYLHSQKPLEIEDVMSSNPIFYVKFSDVENNIGKMMQTELWKKLAKIDYDLIIDKSIADPAQKASVSLLKKQFTDPNLWQMMNKFFGQEFAVAVYPVSKKLKANDPDLVSELASSFILVSRIPSDLQMAEFIARSFKDLGGGGKSEPVKYKNRTIHMVDLSNTGLKVGMVRLGDFIIAGIGDKNAKEAVDLASRQKSSLSGDQIFQKVKAQVMPASGIEGMLNLDKFFEAIKDQMMALAENSPQGKDQAGEFLRTMSGFKVIGFSSNQSQWLTMKWDLFTSFQEMDRRVAKFYTNCTAKENKSLAMIPKEAIGYGWGTCVNLANYWDELKSEVGKIDQQTGKSLGMKNIENFENTTGLDIENDVVAAFGNEMGGFIADVDLPDAAGGFPVPRIVFFVEYGDKSKMDNLLGKLKDNPLFKLADEEYKGTAIKYVSLPGQSKVEPGYAYVDKYLLVALDKALIKKSIDALADPAQALPNSDDFKKLGEELRLPNTSVQFAKVDQFVGIIEKLIQWSETWTNQEKEKREAFKLGTKRRLSDVAYQIETNQENLQEIKGNIEAIKVQITQEKAAGTDGSANQKALTELEAQMTATDKDLQAEEEQKKELEAIIGKYEKDESNNMEEKKFFINKGVLPVLDAFQSIRLMGGYSTLENQILSTTIKLEVE